MDSVTYTARCMLEGGILVAIRKICGTAGPVVNIELVYCHREYCQFAVSYKTFNWAAYNHPYFTVPVLDYELRGASCGVCKPREQYPRKLGNRGPASWYP